MSIVDDVLSCTDDILGIRDCIGANKSSGVFIVCRTWEEKKGVGTPSEKVSQVLPSPQIVSLRHSKRIREAGNNKQGDIMLKYISKQSYKESDLDLRVPKESKLTEEKFYRINDKDYEVLDIEEDYVYFNVTLRKRTRK